MPVMAERGIHSREESASSGSSDLPIMVDKSKAIRCCILQRKTRILQLAKSQISHCGIGNVGYVGNVLPKPHIARRFEAR